MVIGDGYCDGYCSTSLRIYALDKVAIAPMNNNHHLESPDWKEVTAIAIGTPGVTP